MTFAPSSATKPSREERDEAKVKAKARKSEEGAPRKRKSTGDPATPAASSEPTEAPAPKKKIKRLERSVVTDESKLSTEELMETGTYQRFTRIVEHIFDATEDVDLNAPTDMDGDGDVPQEAMITKQKLHELCAEAAKLKVSFKSPLLSCTQLTILFFCYSVNGGHVGSSSREAREVAASTRNEYS